MRGGSIQLKITLWFAAMMALVIAITFGIVLAASNAVMQKTIRDNLVKTVEDNVDEVEYCHQIPAHKRQQTSDLYIAYGEGYLEIDDDYLDEVGEVYTALYHTDGTLLYGENPIALYPDAMPLADRQLRHVRVDGVRYYIYDCNLTATGTQALWLRGIVSEHQGTRQLTSIVQFCVISLPLLFLLAVGGGYWLAGRMLRPVHQITALASQIGQGSDLHKRIGLAAGSDELHQLAQVFDAMFERLDQAFQAEQQFTSDVSHELRTPMAVILAQCEYTLEQTRTPEEYQEALDVIQRQGGRMSRLITDMLCITRMKQQTVRDAGQPVALSALVEEVCRDVGRVQRQDITLIQQITPALTLVGSPSLLGRLATNLLSNAYQYGKPGGTVTVTLDDTPAGIRLVVADDGAGIAADHLPHIFQRFYRADQARSTEGTGLGLAMVQEIAAYHGASVEVASTVGVGSTFTVLFPKELRGT